MAMSTKTENETLNNSAGIDSEPADKQKKSKKTSKSAKKLMEEFTSITEEQEKLTIENAKIKDQYLRLLAEFDNYKKRRFGETGVIMQTVKKETLSELLPVLDDIDRLFEHSEGGKEQVMDGIKLITEKLMQILLNQGVKPMDSKGKQFDPNWHDALMMMENDEVDPGTVIEVHRKGYLFNDNVLRHAKVIVSK